MCLVPVGRQSAELAYLPSAKEDTEGCSVVIVTRAGKKNALSPKPRAQSMDLHGNDGQNPVN